MSTVHKIINTSATEMPEIEDKSIALVVTSPPYPMIEMWDECFSKQSDKVAKSLENNDYDNAFQEMHAVLEQAWGEIDRVLIDSGIVCINIGDSTKNCDGNFKLFSNHSKIIACFMNMGYSVLPDIIWRKQTSAPNKFMGSGMYPPGAYVTYEHEYVLIFRKGRKREFKTGEEKINRQKSAYFWEERNIWFSDIWDLKGTTQAVKNTSTRERSGAYPFELVYRLINMYSVKGDTILDPFAGTGTTMIAAISSERNSIGIEMDKHFCEIIKDNIKNAETFINNRISKRIADHVLFTEQYKKSFIHFNKYHDFPVITSQEVNMEIHRIERITEQSMTQFCATYIEALLSP